MEEIYYYNEQPLQLSYSNTYTLADKLAIIKQIEDDFESGMLSPENMRFIVRNARYGSYTVQRLIDKLMLSGKLKTNPITMNGRTNFKKKTAFEMF
jgi:hypothetical protein